MSYTEEVYERVVAQNPGEPEFHQAVKEVLDSLKVVIDRNEESSLSVFRGSMTTGTYRSTKDTVYSSTVQSDLTREVFVSILQ